VVSGSVMRHLYPQDGRRREVSRLDCLRQQTQGCYRPPRYENVQRFGDETGSATSRPVGALASSDLLRSFAQLVKAAIEEYRSDKASQLASSLAYHALFSLAPLLLMGVGVAGFVFGRDAAEGLIVGQLEDAVGVPAATTIQDVLESARDNRSSATWIGLALAIFAGSGVFLALEDSLNQVFRAPASRIQGLTAAIRKRLLAAGASVSVGVLLLASLGASALISWADQLSEGNAVGLQVVGVVASFVLLVVAIALILQYLTAVRISWKAVWGGAALTAALVQLTVWGVGAYVRWASGNSTWAAVGGVAVILFGAYTVARTFLLGAEFTKVYADRLGRDR